MMNMNLEKWKRSQITHQTITTWKSLICFTGDVCPSFAEDVMMRWGGSAQTNNWRKLFCRSWTCHAWSSNRLKISNSDLALRKPSYSCRHKQYSTVSSPKSSGRSSQRSNRGGEFSPCLCWWSDDKDKFLHQKYGEYSLMSVRCMFSKNPYPNYQPFGGLLTRPHASNPWVPMGLKHEFPKYLWKTILTRLFHAVWTFVRYFHPIKSILIVFRKGREAVVDVW